MEILEKRRRKKNAQLRRGNRYFKAPKGLPTYEVRDSDFYGDSSQEEWTLGKINREIKEARKTMAMLSPLARTRRSVEREYSSLLLRSSPERNSRVLSSRKRSFGLARAKAAIRARQSPTR